MDSDFDFDWKSYEDFVCSVYKNLGDEHGVRILGHGASCKRMGKSGVEHQIDVLASHSDGIHDYMTAIECKYWNKKVNKDTVMKMAGIVEECNFSKGVVVSKEGFTPDAIDYAKIKGIGLIVIRELTDEDWKDRVKIIKWNLKVYRPEILWVDISTHSPSLSEERAEMIEERDPRDTFIVYPDGRRRTLADLLWQDFFGKLKEDKNFDVAISRTFSFDKGTMIRYQDQNLEFFPDSITVKGKLSIVKVSEKEIYGPDYVQFMMKSIFEGDSILLDKNGNKFKVL